MLICISEKAKWTAIPATELQAAADKAAENQRRARLDQAAAKKREAAKAESSVSPIKGNKPRKGVSVPTIPEGRKSVRTSRAGSGEIRLPPFPAGQRGSIDEFKPVFGSISHMDSTTPSEASVMASTTGPATKEINGAAEGKQSGNAVESNLVNGGFSEPISRQSSRHSRIESSPQRARTTHSSPRHTSQPLETAPSASESMSSQNMRIGSGPYNRNMAGTSTAPLPQHPFNPISNHHMPRPPRGRDGIDGGRGGRGGYAGRGRGGGGYRSNSALPMGAQIGVKNGGLTSPPGNQSNLPNVEGMTYGPGINMYQRGYNSMAFYPGNQFVQQGMYDAMGYPVAGHGQRGFPPPPMPMTIVPNLDPLRFYVLGQVGPLLWSVFADHLG